MFSINKSLPILNFVLITYTFAPFLIGFFDRYILVDFVTRARRLNTVNPLASVTISCLTNFLFVLINKMYA